MTLIKEVAKNIVALFNSEKMGELIIQTQVTSYKRLREAKPNADPHELLSNVYLARIASIGTKDEEIEEDLKNASYIHTYIFACVPEYENARALGLYFLYKERPDIITSNPKFSREYGKHVGELSRIQEEQPEELAHIYFKLNPNNSSA